MICGTFAATSVNIELGQTFFSLLLDTLIYIAMRFVRSLEHSLRKSLYSTGVTLWKSLSTQTSHLSRACSCNARLALAVTSPLNVNKNKVSYTRRDPKKDEKKQQQKKEEDKKKDVEALKDHRAIGAAHSLFFTHPSSPGTPFFLPDGTHIFQKLVAFIRAQYPRFGFREVLTPTIYKEALWEQSGHWQNYKEDMFTVIANPSDRLEEPIFEKGRMQPRKSLSEQALEEYGLKPMNCPGHCLLYNIVVRSYRDLPIRYAEFSPLHRNEISGALSGLTRVRRFHQDDGHIFCRPNQVKESIMESLNFIQTVYKTLDLNNYHLVLSTRPKSGFIGQVEEWDRAEDQLKAALNEFNMFWRTNKGEGAFYGPKIDVILRDNDNKYHQTGTIQLDFQLPKRFDLEYESPAPALEAKEENWKDSELRATVGKVTPVMIHRAVLGSLERFMALLVENHNHQLPFWLNPKQIAILTVNVKDNVTAKDNVAAYAQKVKKTLISKGKATNIENQLESLAPPKCLVDIDDSTDSIAQKIVRAKKAKYSIILIVGNKNVGGTVDFSVSTPDMKKTWSLIEQVKPGSRAPVQQDKGVGAHFRGLEGVRLEVEECKNVISRLNDNYC